MKNIILFLLFLIANACCKPNFIYNKVLKNSTEHHIELIYYTLGKSYATFTINKNSTVKNNVVIQDNTDSLIVIWDDLYSVAHYIPNKEGNTKNSIKQNEPRSLFNNDSYIEEIQNRKCDGKTTTLTYTFTEQDYLDAKK